MAEEALIRVKVDTKNAKKNIDGMKKSLGNAAQAAGKLGAKSSSALLRLGGPAVLASIVGKIASGGIGGGAFGAAGGFVGDAFSETGRKLLGDNLAGQAGNVVAGSVAREKAGQQVRDIVGAGGAFSDKELIELLESFTEINRPGAQNVQQLNRVQAGFNVEQVLADILAEMKGINRNITAAPGGGGGRR